MKTNFTIFLIVISAYCGAQPKQISQLSNIAYFENPIVFFDSVETRFGFFDFDSSLIVRVDRANTGFDSATNSHGKIYITSKNPARHHFLSFTEFKKKYVPNQQKPVLLLLNGNFTKNPSQINIDETYIHRVKVNAGADYDELKNVYPLLTIVNLITKKSENAKGERSIYLQSPEERILLNNLPE